MPGNKPYYRILQVDPSAEPEIITAAYKRLALKYHPDSNKSPDAVRRMQEINEAYEVLSDPVKRERYNLQLSGDAYRAQAGNSAAKAEVRRPTPATRDAGREAADRRLGYSFMAVYCVMVVLLFRIFITRITSIWMVLFIFTAAAVLALLVVGKIEDWMKGG